MQSTKSETKQLNKPGWPRRLSDHQKSAAARPAQRSRPTLIVGHTVTTVGLYYESIWLDPIQILPLQFQL